MTGKATSAGGWILFAKPLQDAGFFASFRCQGPCDTGVPVRSKKLPTEARAYSSHYKEGALGSFRVTLDARGKILTRDALRPIGGQVRLAPRPHLPVDAAAVLLLFCAPMTGTASKSLLKAIWRRYRGQRGG